MKQESKIENILRNKGLNPVRVVTEAKHQKRIKEGYRFVENCVPQIDQNEKVRTYQEMGLDVLVEEKAYSVHGLWCPQLRALFIKERN